MFGKITVFAILSEAEPAALIRSGEDGLGEQVN
jgi:hypothetical protein